MTGSGYRTALRHAGHKAGVVLSGGTARLMCLECRVVLAEPGDAEEARRWAAHADPEADSLTPKQYEDLNPCLVGLPEHWVTCVTYGEPGSPASVAVECEHCGEVLVDFDADEEEKE